MTEREASGGGEAGDDAAIAGYAEALADAADDVIAGWVRRCVERRLVDWSGSAEPEVLARAQVAGGRARAEVIPALRELLATDVDAQRSTPLAVLRRAVRYPTEVLAGAGVPAVVRDELAERAFPEDAYDLVPGSFADVDPALREPGLLWGAAKAHVVLRRRRAEGRA